MVPVPTVPRNTAGQDAGFLSYDQNRALTKMTGGTLPGPNAICFLERPKQNKRAVGKKKAVQNPKLEALRKKEAELKAQIAKFEAKEKAKADKQTNRVKLLIGGAVISDIEKNPDNRAVIVAVLDRSVTAANDRAFLKSKGWL